MANEDVRYTQAHTWMREEGGEFFCGVTQYAADKMGDVIFVELPEAGASVSAGDPYGSLESAKAVEDLIAPLSGKVLRVNEALVDAPEVTNQDPYGEGWMIVVSPVGEVDYDATLSAEQYEEYTKTLS